MVLALDKATEGSIRFLGEELTGRDEAALRPLRREMQVVFQDPYGSFNPRHQVERLVAEPLHLLDAKLSKHEVELLRTTVQLLHVDPMDITGPR